MDICVVTYKADIPKISILIIVSIETIIKELLIKDWIYFRKKIKHLDRLEIILF